MFSVKVDAVVGFAYMVESSAVSPCGLSSRSTIVRLAGVRRTEIGSGGRHAGTPMATWGWLRIIGPESLIVLWVIHWTQQPSSGDHGLKKGLTRESTS